MGKSIKNDNEELKNNPNADEHASEEPNDVKEQVEMVKLSALTTIIHNEKTILPGKKFEIEVEYAERLVANKAAEYVEKEPEEEGAEE